MLEPMRALVRGLEQRAQVGAAPPEMAAWFASQGVPPPLVELLTTCWPQVTTDLVPFLLLSSTELRSDTDVPRLLHHRLLKIGACPNGDPLVLDLATEGLVPGAVEHGLLWGREPEDEDPRAYHLPIARDLATFCARLATGRPVPRDHWAARSFDPQAPDADGGG